MVVSALKAYALADPDAAARLFKHEYYSWDKSLLAKPYSAYHGEHGAANYHDGDAVSQFFALGPHCLLRIFFFPSEGKFANDDHFVTNYRPKFTRGEPPKSGTRFRAKLCYPFKRSRFGSLKNSENSLLISSTGKSLERLAQNTTWAHYVLRFAPSSREAPRRRGRCQSPNGEPETCRCRCQNPRHVEGIRTKYSSILFRFRAPARGRDSEPVL
jgi:hypothetical protein